MGLNLPEDAAAIDRLIKQDIKAELPQSNPFLRNSWFAAFATTLANRLDDFSFSLRRVEAESIPDTAVDQLERWASIFGIFRGVASGVTSTTNKPSLITFTGTVGSAIPIGSIVASSDGQPYPTKAAVTIQNVEQGISGITNAGGIATATTTADNHGMSSSVQATVGGAVQPEYNGIFDITIVAANQFTYAISGTPITATGTITVAGDFASAEVTSTPGNVGAVENQDFPTPLTLQSPIAGVDDEALVEFDGLTGGIDAQTDESLRSELVERIREPVAHFNASDIVTQAKLIDGVTRVFVNEASPAAGQVEVYFMRDNDPDPIPVGALVTEVKDSLRLILPANTDDADLIVSGPTGVPIPFTIDALVQASGLTTTSMQDAIVASLEQFFAENTEIGEDVTKDAWNAAISNTLDTTNGDTITSFNVSLPLATVPIAAGEIGTLQSVTFDL